MTEFKYVGLHLDDVADGRLLEPGRTVDLDEQQQADPHNAQRIKAGLLIPVQHDSNIDATEEAKQLAADNGIDIRDVTGTGANGRVLKGDIEKHIENKEGND